jgi:hypothetical protein
MSSPPTPGTVIPRTRNRAAATAALAANRRVCAASSATPRSATRRNITRGVIPLPASWQPGVRAVARCHWVVPALWYLVIALMILNRFWYCWRTLL